MVSILPLGKEDSVASFVLTVFPSWHLTALFPYKKSSDYTSLCVPLVFKCEKSKIIPLVVNCCVVGV